MDEGTAAGLPPAGDKAENKAVPDSRDGAGMGDPELGGVYPGGKGAGNGDRSGILQEFTSR
jgi:hypothetical protein